MQDLRLLRIFNYYRVILSAALVITFFNATSGDGMLEIAHPQVFIGTAVSYFSLTLILAFVFRKPVALKAKEIVSAILIDLLALTLVTYAHAGVTGGLANLMIFSVAAGSILLGGRYAAFFAATASLLILAGEVARQTFDSPSADQYFQTGIMGMVFFTIALLVRTIARRIQTSETLAEQQALDIAQLQQLNERIIQRMRTGILVSDAHGIIQLVNAAARQQLTDIPQRAPYGKLPAILHQRLQVWLHSPQQRTLPFRVSENGQDLQANFAQLKQETTEDQHSEILIFLEDISKSRQQAQQLKLASLGQLAASIAHEIRNPLGAISHAAQLLAESDAIHEADLQLTQIMQNHSQRLNGIIENVLQISRRQASKPESVQLQDWLENFAVIFNEGNHEPGEFDFSAVAADASVTFDPGQLNQVITNLAHNGLRYSKQHRGQAIIHFSTGNHSHTGLTYLDVTDEGPGITAQEVSRLFEPFHTTENDGTGLGLFISRELCEANHARLELIETPPGTGACFRITFPHPDRLAA